MDRRQFLTASGALCAAQFMERDSRAENGISKELESLKKKFFCGAHGPIAKDHEKTLKSLRSMGLRTPQRSPTNSPSDKRKFQLTLNTSLIWRQAVVTYRFAMADNDGGRVKAAIENAFEEWQPHCGLRFVETPGVSTDITIGFRDEGYWSLLGIDSRNTQDTGGISLNIQPGGGKREYRRAALHEIGHALGAIHEHQSRIATKDERIPWNEPVLNAYYKRAFGWNPDDVQSQVIELYKEDVSNQLDGSSFDQLSIMTYIIPKEVLIPVDGYEKFVVDEFRSELSDTDKEMMRRIYGVKTLSSTSKTEAKKSEPEVRAKAADAVALVEDHVTTGVIPKGKQNILYKATPKAGAKYTIQTVDGARNGVARTESQSVIIELFDGTDFAPTKAIATSQLGGPTGDEAVGIGDAYLERQLDLNKEYYILVSPIGRRQDVDANFKLILTQRLTPEQSAGSFASIRKEIQGKLESAIETQDRTNGILKELRNSIDSLKAK